MNEFYNEIMSLADADEIKAVVNRWNNLSENIKVKPANKPIILPDILMIAKTGVGRSRLLRLMSNYLYEQGNLMDFCGEVKYFEFMLGYCKPGEVFTEFQRFTDEIRKAAGFRNDYKGIIHIDINEWLRHLEESNFISFMEYLSSNRDNWLIVLSAYSDNKDEIKKLKAIVSMYLRIEKVILELPKTENLVEFIEKELDDYGLKIDGSAKLLLSKSIERLRGNKYFDGYKSLKMLCQDIVYSVFSESCVKSDILTENELGSFSENSEYIEKMIYKIEQSRKIGFAQ